MSRNRVILWVVGGANAVVVAASLAIGFWVTQSYESLVFAANKEQAQRLADAAVDDLLWRTHFATVSRVAADIGAEAELRKLLLAKDGAGIERALADVHKRGAFSGGEVALTGVTVFDAEAKPLAERWLGAGGVKVPAALAATLAARSGGERLRAIQSAWLHDGRPVLSVVAPVGGLRFAGYVVLHVDPLPALGTIDQRLGMEVSVRSLADATPLTELGSFRVPQGARTVGSTIALKGPDGAPLATLAVVEDVTALVASLAATRLDSLLVFVVLAGTVGLGSLLVTRQYLRASERRALAAERELQAHAAEDTLRREREAAAEREAVARRDALLASAMTLEDQVRGRVEAVAAAAAQVEMAARTVATSSTRTVERSTAAAHASAHATATVSSVAGATEELNASIQEIGRQVAESGTATSAAVREAQAADRTVEGLGTAAEAIGEVVRLIAAIAGQTNLLALNATIEAARAGEAGRGFAVVASEVKNLAAQTARATDEIQLKVAEVQGSAQSAVGAIRGISATIARINAIAGAISTTVVEQGGATREITGNVQRVAEDTERASEDAASVAQEATAAGTASEQLLQAAEHLARDASGMRADVETFLGLMRAA